MEHNSAELAVDVTGLTKIYGTRRVVDSLDLKIRKGTICGLAGPNGAGKTTAIRMVLGLIQRDGGDGHVLGAELDLSLIHI